MKIEVNDYCIVYRNSNRFPEGAVVQVIDRDGHNKDEFLVSTLQDIGKHLDTSDPNTYVKLLKYHSEWVKQKDLKPISFNREKKPFWKKIFGL